MEDAIERSRQALEALYKTLPAEKVAAIHGAAITGISTVITGVIMSIVTGNVGKDDSEQQLTGQQTLEQIAILPMVKELAHALVLGAIDASGRFSIEALRVLMVEWLQYGVCKTPGSAAGPSDINQIGAMIASRQQPAASLMQRHSLLMPLVPALALMHHVLTAPHTTPASVTLH